MAGPVPTYLTTQTAAQTAFTVSFGLLAFVNSAIATATAAGEFNVTVDCSLFVTEDVSNLRIYLDSLGYNVEFAKNTSDKSLNIDWGRFLDIPGTEVIVDQGTSPWVVSGTVTAVLSGVSPLATGAVTGVANSVLTTIVTYTAATPKTISRISSSGTLYAKFQLFFNTLLIETYRSGPERTIQFLFPSPLSMEAGDILDVKVTHYYTPETGDFEATVYGG